VDGAWLLIETSGRGGLVALALDGTVVGERPLDPTRRHNRDLAPFAAALLSDSGLTPRQLRGVAVGAGPGSYTGLRVGLISAKVLSYATGCDLVAVPTFAAVAELAPAGLPSLDVISDGLQGLVYAQHYERTGGAFIAVDALHIAPVADWLATNPRAVSGPGVPLVEGMLPADVARLPADLRMPTAASLLAAARRFPPVSRADLYELEPLYLRPSSAEEQAARKAALAGRGG
jgi:tRNA threonylcarbamoyladenosine biosynthesis protein TsaB